MGTIRDNPRIDPYVKWGLDSDFRGFKRPCRTPDGQWQLPVAVELRMPLPSISKIPKKLTVKGWLKGSRFLSALVWDQYLPLLVGLPFVKRIKLGLPSTPTGQRTFTLDSLAVNGPPVLGFIDHGVAFLNSAFQDHQGGSRVFSFWDQEDYGASMLKPPEPWVESDFRYGRELDNKLLQTWLANHRRSSTEDELYAMLGYDACRKRVAHGTHVMGLAAGKRVPSILGGGTDHASTSPIVAVQLPYKPFKDTSGSSLCINILDGLRFIVSKVQGLRPVVINISDGAYAGSHDGESLLECAIEEFLAQHKNVTLVIAAGNGFDQRLHAASRPRQPSGTLKWRILPGTSTDSFLEVWCLDASNVEVKLAAPDGTEHIVALGQNQPVLAADRRTVIGGVYSTCDADLNGSSRAMFLVALAPTRPKAAAYPAAPHGVWSLTVSGTSSFDAYIQRNNPALGDRGQRRQSFFVDDDRGLRSVTGCRTLNNIATGKAPFVVGGHFLNGSMFEPRTAMTHRVTPYSSAGPGRKGLVQGVNVHAPAEQSPALHGLLGTGVRSGSSVRMGGTSVSAPIVTRFEANRLSDPTHPPDHSYLLLPAGDDRLC